MCVFNINPRDGVLAAHLLRWRRRLVQVRPQGVFLVFLLFIFFVDLTSNILLNSSYSQYPPRGWDASIRAFNLGFVGSSRGSA